MPRTRMSHVAPTPSPETVHPVIDALAAGLARLLAASSANPPEPRPHGLDPGNEIGLSVPLVNSTLTPSVFCFDDLGRIDP